MGENTDFLFAKNFYEDVPNSFRPNNQEINNTEP